MRKLKDLINQDIQSFFLENEIEFNNDMSDELLNEIMETIHEHNHETIGY